MLRGAPALGCRASVAHLGCIWAPEAAVAWDPENTHQRQFTGDFKEKPGEDRQRQRCGLVEASVGAVGVGEKGPTQNARGGGWQRKPTPSGGDAVVSTLQMGKLRPGSTALPGTQRWRREDWDPHLFHFRARTLPSKLLCVWENTKKRRFEMLKTMVINMFDEIKTYLDSQQSPSNLMIKK